MEEKTRLQMLEGILKRLCQVRTLHYDVIKDFLVQLKNMTTGKDDEEESLLERWAKTDICFCKSSLWHSGQRGLLLPITRVSNSLPQARQIKSNNGIYCTPYEQMVNW